MIKVIRLKSSGIEIITKLTPIADQGNSVDEYLIEDPMRFGFVQGQSGMSYLQLFQLLPLSIYKDRSCKIDKSEVFYIAEPSGPLLEYYNETINKLNDILKKSPNQEFATFHNIEDMIRDVGGLEEVPIPGTPKKLN